jgi:hypothetical protein
MDPMARLTELAATLRLCFRQLIGWLLLCSSILEPLNGYDLNEATQSDFFFYKMGSGGTASA